MKKVFLVMRIIPTGMGEDEEPFKVFVDRKKAEECADKIFGFVKELDFIE